jgi:hypothetical protein
MSSVLDQRAQKYASQSAALFVAHQAGPTESARKTQRLRYGTRLSTGEITTRISNGVLREIQSEAARVIDVAAGLEAAGFVYIGHSGPVRFQQPLRRSVLSAVFEKSDGNVAIVRVSRGSHSERRRLDAIQLSSSGIEEPGQMFNIVIAERSRPDGGRENQISFERCGTAERRRSIPLLSAADVSLFAKV